MARMIGMDEAGLGPNLGPLVHASVAVEFPGPLANFEFWHALAPFVVPISQPPSANALVIGDSKSLFTPGKRLDGLEQPLSVFVTLAGFNGHTLADLFTFLAPHASASVLPEPWFSNLAAAPAFGHTCNSVLVDALREHFHREQLTIELKADAVATPRFNDTIAAGYNKSETSTSVALQVLAELWSPAEVRETLIQCDKQGGRNRYDLALSTAFPAGFFIRQRESAEVSQYQCGTTTIRFEPRSERYPLVALASMLAKYLRERLMAVWNTWWQARVPHLRPTAGYPVDAKRFALETHAYRLNQAIPDHVFWRSR